MASTHASRRILGVALILPKHHSPKFLTWRWGEKLKMSRTNCLKSLGCFVRLFPTDAHQRSWTSNECCDTKRHSSLVCIWSGFDEMFSVQSLKQLGNLLKYMGMWDVPKCGMQIILCRLFKTWALEFLPTPLHCNVLSIITHEEQVEMHQKDEDYFIKK